MSARKTCDRCAHFTVSDYAGQGVGDCAKALDFNRVHTDWSSDEHQVDMTDRVAGWDAESYSAGVHVGPKFGCIHWVKKP